MKTFTAFVLIFFAFFISGCLEPQVVTAPPIVPDKIEGFLAWDGPELRKEWTPYLMQKIDEHWSDLSPATDMPELCEKYSTMTGSEKKEVWGELFVAMAFHESAWKPESRYFEKTMGYYSEGLFQVSVVDNSWSKCGLTKETILQPLPNINCAILLMSRQIRLYREVMIKKGAYWAVIKEGNRYQKIPDIKARIKVNVPKCSI